VRKWRFDSYLQCAREDLLYFVKHDHSIAGAVLQMVHDARSDGFVYLDPRRGTTCQQILWRYLAQLVTNTETENNTILYLL
jgi:hypothetical protein